jgi:pleiotropic regulator 1
LLLLLLLLLFIRVCRWVRSIAFDPSNEWFCTGSSDRTIKLWETGTGQLKLTLTGHIEQVTFDPWYLSNVSQQQSW